MIVLGIETATALCGVSLVENGQLFAASQLNKGFAHAEKLPGMIQKSMEDASLTLADVDGIAVSIGPGSFTGLRIGLGVAKGIALALNKPVIPVSTMDVLVDALPTALEACCTTLYARKGEIYLASYRVEEGQWQQKGEIRTILVEKLDEALPSGACFYVGEGVLRNLESFSKIDRVRMPESQYAMPNPYHVARLGEIELKAGNVSPVDDLVPLYIKRFQGVA